VREKLKCDVKIVLMLLNGLYLAKKQRGERGLLNKMMVGLRSQRKAKKGCKVLCLKLGN